MKRITQNLELKTQNSLRVILAYSLLTIALTWPLATQFTTNMPDGADSWQHLQTLWWAKVSLVDLHTDFYHTNYLYYPGGVNLYFDTPMPLIAVIGIPLQLAGLNLVTIYNVLMLMSFVIAGYGAYLLAKFLTGNGAASFVGGFIFAFSPYHFAHMLGQINIASIEWIPFYVLSLLKALSWPAASSENTSKELSSVESDHEPGAGDHVSRFAFRASPSGSFNVRWAILAGIWLAAVSYTEWTYTFFLLLFTLGAILWRLLINPRLLPVRVLTSMAVAFGVWLLLVAPVLIPTVQEANNTAYAQESPNDAEYFGSDLTDALVPSLFHPLWKTLGLTMNVRWQTKPRPEKIVFVGFTVLLIALAASILLRRRPGILFWTWSAVGAWLLSLGPYLYVAGQNSVFGTTIQLPYSWLYALPFFDIMRVPSRFTVLVMLALAVLVGYGLAGASAGRRWLLRGRPIGSMAWLPVGLLILFEYLPVPYPMQQLNYDEPLYHEIAQEPGQFAILDLPLTRQAVYEGYQTIHGKPIVDGYLARQPEDPLVDSTPVLRYLLPSVGVDDPLSGQAAQDGVAELRAANIRYVILHEFPSAESAPDEVALRDKIARIFSGITPRVVQGHLGTLTIFQLTP